MNVCEIICPLILTSHKNMVFQRTKFLDIWYFHLVTCYDWMFWRNLLPPTMKFPLFLTGWNCKTREMCSFACQNANQKICIRIRSKMNIIVLTKNPQVHQSFDDVSFDFHTSNIALCIIFLSSLFGHWDAEPLSWTQTLHAFRVTVGRLPKAVGGKGSYPSAMTL